MKFLKKNTAVRIMVGPFLDSVDGVTPETALTVTNCSCEMFVDADDGSGVTRTAITLTASGGSNDMVHITSDTVGMYDLELTAAQLNVVGRMTLCIIDTDVHLPVWHEFMILPAEVYDSLVAGTDKLPVDVAEVSSDSTAADNLELMFDGTGYAGGTTKLKVDLETIKTQTVTCAAGVTVLANVGTTNAIDVEAGGCVGIDWGNIANPTTVVTMSGTTIYDVSNSTALTTLVDAVWDEVVTSGHTTAGSSGKLIGDNVNAPIATVDTVVDAIKVKTDYLPSATAGAAGGVFIAGSNAATTVNITGNLTGNVTGSVGSVTGAVGSVTGNVGGNVVGSVASVTGAVGSIAANGITATSIATDAINAASVKADAVTKIQSGLATSSALTTVEGKVDTIDGIVDSILVDTGTTLDGKIDTIDTNVDAILVDTGTTLDGNITAIKAKTDNLPAAPAATGDSMALTSAAVDAVLDEVVEGSLTMRQVLKGLLAFIAGDTTGGGTTTVTFKSQDGLTDRIVMTVDSDGDRSDVTLSL